MEVDYMVQIKNIGTPLLKAISIYDLAIFYQLYEKENSDFRKWCNNNNVQNIGYNDENIIELVNKYFEMSIDEVFINLTEYKKRYTGQFTKSRTGPQVLPQELAILTGGADKNKPIKKNEIKELYFRVVRYLFSPNNPDPSMIPTPKPMADIISIQNISGQNENDRLVFIVGLNEIKTVFKIARNDSQYEIENKIYTELNNEMNRDAALENKIIKKYSTNSRITKISMKKEIGYQVFINWGDGNKEINILQKGLAAYFNKIKTFVEHNNNAIFLALEYNPDFKTVYHINNAHGKSMLTQNQKCQLVENVIKTLHILNKKVGFSHWDLHEDNLLVNPLTQEFKLFDFDQSSTNDNINKQFFRLVGDAFY